MSNSVLPRLREVGDDEVTAWMARFDEHGVTYRASDAARLRLHLAGGLSAKTLEAAMQDRLANCDARPDLTRVLVAADLLRMAADGSSTAASTRLMVEALEEWGQMAAYRRVKEARDAEVASVVDNWDAIAAAEKFAVERPQRITRFFLGTHALVADTLAGLLFEDGVEESAKRKAVMDGYLFAYGVYLGLTDPAFAHELTELLGEELLTDPKGAIPDALSKLRGLI